MAKQPKAGTHNRKAGKRMDPAAETSFSLILT